MMNNYPYRQTNVPPHTPVKSENQNDYHRCSSSSTTTTTTTTTTDELCQEKEMRQGALIRISCEALREQYLACIGRPMPPSIHRNLLRDLLAGEPAEYYHYALDEAAMAPHPSWRYVMAIVNRLNREGVPPGDLIGL